MKKKLKINLQLNETERWWNSKNILKFNNLSKLTDRKIIALGGINEINIKKLRFLKCNGYASITYLKNRKQIRLI